MAFSKTIELQRVRYWQGQKLRSRDLHDQFDMAAQLRWWHNRALHNAYGIGFGLRASAVFDANQQEVAAVRITCGVAYDCFGRELFLQNTRKIPVPTEPPQDGENVATLLVTYKDNAHFPTKSDWAELCDETAPLRLQEQPEFVWKPLPISFIPEAVPLAQVRYGSFERLDSLPAEVKFPDHLKISYDDVRRILIFIGVMSSEEKNELLKRSTDPLYLEAIEKLHKKSQDQKQKKPVLMASEFWPAFAHALARPRLASGATIPGNTPWKAWTPSGTQVLGYEVVIDTSTAGFTQTPCYFAWLQGHKPLWNQTPATFFPAFFPHLAQPSMKSFVFRLWMPPLSLGAKDNTNSNQNITKEFLRFARNQELFVCWLGIQPVSTHAQ